MAYPNPVQSRKKDKCYFVWRYSCDKLLSNIGRSGLKDKLHSKKKGGICHTELGRAAGVPAVGSLRGDISGKVKGTTSLTVTAAFLVLRVMLPTPEAYENTFGSFSFSFSFSLSISFSPVILAQSCLLGEEKGCEYLRIPRKRAREGTRCC